MVTVNKMSVTLYSQSIHTTINKIPRLYFHFVAAVGLACLKDPKSYAGGSIATVRVSHAGQLKGDRPD
jgi:hypothetical protein